LPIFTVLTEWLLPRPRILPNDGLEQTVREMIVSEHAHIGHSTFGLPSWRLRAVDALDAGCQADKLPDADPVLMLPLAIESRTGMIDAANGARA
jgi:hypothetical protein